jgi:hypothetical protein
VRHLDEFPEMSRIVAALHTIVAAETKTGYAVSNRMLWGRGNRVRSTVGRATAGPTTLIIDYEGVTSRQVTSIRDSSDSGDSSDNGSDGDAKRQWKQTPQWY